FITNIKDKNSILFFKGKTIKDFNYNYIIKLFSPYKKTALSAAL
ncbi:MAG: hypothetical protein PWP75_1096, partial [Caldanaerobacter sp.]|nr:hypothetical protein [Caldanaerobacter sp.]